MIDLSKKKIETINPTKEYEFDRFTVNFDDDVPDVFEGWYIPGESWNGWKCPVFSLGDALKIAKNRSTPCYFIVYNEYADHFIVYSKDYEDDSEMTWDIDCEIIEPVMVRIKGSGDQLVKMYPLGSHSWTWDTLDTVPDEKIKICKLW